MNSLDMEVPADVGTIRRRNSTTLIHTAQNTPLEVLGGVFGGGWSSDPSHHLNLPIAIRAFIGLALQLVILPI